MKTALELIEKLNSKGFEAYLVGGSVRDKIMGREINDFDLTTNALPDEIKKVFSDKRLILSGEKHGTIAVAIDKEVYEITTFRTDGDYNDFRHPDNVKFVTNLKDDLSRRDFTINALAYSENVGIVDLFGGVQDIENKIIKTVGESKKRFEEDALRILRAVRFSAQLGFTIDKDTFNAMLDCKGYLHNISVERIFIELTKTLCADFAAETLYTCREIIFEVIPELRRTFGFEQFSLAHDYDVFNHTLSCFKNLKNRNPEICWALLLHDIAKPDCLVFDKNGYGHTWGHMELSAERSKDILKRFKAPKDFSEEVVTLIAYHDADIGKSKYEVKKFLFKYGEKILEDLLYLKMADIYAHSVYGIRKYLSSRVKLRNAFNEIKSSGECYSFQALNINGNDLVSIGFSGKKLGDTLEKILDSVMKGELENNKIILLDYAKSIS